MEVSAQIRKTYVVLGTTATVLINSGLELMPMLFFVDFDEEENPKILAALDPNQLSDFLESKPGKISLLGIISDALSKGIHGSVPKAVALVNEAWGVEKKFVDDRPVHDNPKKDEYLHIIVYTQSGTFGGISVIETDAQGKRHCTLSDEIVEPEGDAVLHPNRTFH